MLNRTYTKLIKHEIKKLKVGFLRIPPSFVYPGCMSPSHLLIIAASRCNQIASATIKPQNAY